MEPKWCYRLPLLAFPTMSGQAKYDVEKALRTQEQCRTVMKRALAHGDHQLYAAAFVSYARFQQRLTMIHRIP
jgi:hypothetical protein